MSADNSNTPPDDQTANTLVKGNDVLAERLANVEEQLRAFNEASKAQTEALLASTRKPAKEETEDNEYDPRVIKRQAKEEMSAMLREEKAKDAMIWDLAQEYPEIKSEPKIRAAILEAQKSLPDAIKDTAAGYEAAVLKAVTKAGLVAKSKRQTPDEDFSMGSRSGGDSRPKGKAKVTQNMLAIAQLMGRDVNDPEVVKRLEAAANRDSYNKYR